MFKNIKDIEIRRITEFTKACKNNEFDIYLQPQVRTSDEKIIGFEALIRWVHPEKGILSPYHFMDIIEAFDISQEFDYMVFDKVCRILYNRIQAGKSLFPISCNFSREHFVNDDFIETIEEIRNKYNVPIEYLSIEILEGEKFSDETKAQKIINKLASKGYKVSLDDYGATEFCMDDLLLENITCIKIDKNIIDNIENEEMQERLNTLCDFTHANNQATICEGVETYTQLMLAQKCGVDIIQGYYFYKPMDVEKAMILFDKMKIN